ncbi:hypothetical protein [Micromonospora sp. NPDC049240]|uniref:hypothetical protein n=1 Tax=Micromonospora sp. NPDC049240 TaxID=3155151 RepID=UPI0033E95D5A
MTQCTWPSGLHKFSPKGACTRCGTPSTPPALPGTTCANETNCVIVPWFFLCIDHGGFVSPTDNSDEQLHRECNTSLEGSDYCLTHDALVAERD